MLAGATVISGAKKLPGKLQPALHSLFRELHRLLFAHRIEEVASVVEPVHDVEVITLPGAVRVEEVSGEKRQDRLINSGLVVSHVGTLSRLLGVRNFYGLTPELSRPAAGRRLGANIAEGVQSGAALMRVRLE